MNVPWSGFRFDISIGDVDLKLGSRSSQRQHSNVLWAGGWKKQCVCIKMKNDAS